MEDVEYLIIVQQDGSIESRVFKYSQESQMVAWFSAVRIIGGINDVVLLKNLEAIAFGEQSVYSASMNMVFEHHLYKKVQ